MTNTLLLFGLALAGGGVGSVIFRLLRLPQVIGHILLGVLLGVSGLALFHMDNLPSYKLVTDLSLGFIGFGIGGELRWARLKRFGVNILMITLCESLLAAGFVFGAVFLFSRDLVLSLIIGSLAAATAPGGTTNVLQEYRARGPLTSTLFGVVGADDAIAIMIYTVASALGFSLLKQGGGFTVMGILHVAGLEIFGALFLGIVMGIMVSFIMLRVKDDDMKQLVILSALFICVGISVYWHVSLILSTMSMGILVGNYRPHRSRAYFVLVQRLTPPLYIMFFVLVGARLDVTLLATVGVVGVIYIVFRIMGKYVGAYVGALISHAPSKVTRYLGFCLFSQAGVAIGLAMAAEGQLSAISSAGSAIGAQVIGMITGTTLVFQVMGPIFTKFALSRAGEIRLYAAKR